MTQQDTANTKKTPKLTPSQVSGLIAVACGAMALTKPGGNDFFVDVGFGRLAGFPSVEQPKSTFKALQRLGYVETCDPVVTGFTMVSVNRKDFHRFKVRLTESGNLLYQATISEEMRGQVADHVARRQREDLELKAGFLRSELQHGLLAQRRQRWEPIEDKSRRVTELRAQVTELGLKIGDGANNVDDLLVELRRTVQTLRDLEQWIATARAQGEAATKREDEEIEATVREQVYGISNLPG